MFRVVFRDILPCKMYMYIPEDNSEHHTRRRENLKSHNEGHRPKITEIKDFLRLSRHTF
jgi:hypothetical protein